jgi:hypothetical protein
MNTCLGSRTHDGFGYRERIIGRLPNPDKSCMCAVVFDLISQATTQAPQLTI